MEEGDLGSGVPDHPRQGGFGHVCMWGGVSITLDLMLQLETEIHGSRKRLLALHDYICVSTRHARP